MSEKLSLEFLLPIAKDIYVKTMGEAPFEKVIKIEDRQKRLDLVTEEFVEFTLKIRQKLSESK